MIEDRTFEPVNQPIQDAAALYADVQTRFFNAQAVDKYFDAAGFAAEEKAQRAAAVKEFLGDPIVLEEFTREWKEQTSGTLGQQTADAIRKETALNTFTRIAMTADTLRLERTGRLPPSEEKPSPIRKALLTKELEELSKIYNAANDLGRIHKHQTQAVKSS